MPFKAGNKHGRGRPPAGKSLSEALRIALAEKRSDGRTNNRAIADALVAKACDGDVAAFKEIIERVEGKVPPSLPGDADRKRTVQIMMYPEDLKTM